MSLPLHEAASICAIAAALILLLVLSLIDLREGILPDKLVAAFAVTGVIFHGASHFLFLGPLEMAEGAWMGGGILYAIRLIANYWQKADALGLGDVKLLAAAGIWLGPHDVIIALMAGAAAGIFHGLGGAFYEHLKTKRPINLKTLSLPAGPGFAAGIVIAGVMKFWALPAILNL